MPIQLSIGYEHRICIFIIIPIRVYLVFVPPNLSSSHFKIISSISSDLSTFSPIFLRLTCSSARAMVSRSAVSSLKSSVWRTILPDRGEGLPVFLPTDAWGGGAAGCAGTIPAAFCTASLMLVGIFFLFWGKAMTLFLGQIDYFPCDGFHIRLGLFRLGVEPGVTLDRGRVFSQGHSLPAEIFVS